MKLTAMKPSALPETPMALAERLWTVASTAYLNAKKNKGAAATHAIERALAAATEEKEPTFKEVYAKELHSECLRLAVEVKFFESKLTELERELAMLRETVGVRGDASATQDDCNNWAKLVARADKAPGLERENRELREDKARLDWLNEHEAAVEVNDEELLTCRVSASDDYQLHGFSDPYEIRAAIDAARQALPAARNGKLAEPRGGAT